MSKNTRSKTIVKNKVGDTGLITSKNQSQKNKADKQRSKKQGQTIRSNALQ